MFAWLETVGNDVGMELSAVQLRILGCLVEKEATTPDNYPVSSNSLVNACNQTSNRDPVVSYDARTIDTAMLELRTAGLARTVTGGRTNKHRHVLDEAWGTSAGDQAVLAVLFLRGPQTPGELRGRTDRIHHFDTPGDVELVLGTLADRTEPFVTQLHRRPGQKESRWAHLLGDSFASHDPEPGAEPLDVPGASAFPTPTTLTASRAEPDNDLRAELAQLRSDVDRLYELLGETRPGGH